MYVYIRNCSRGAKCVKIHIFYSIKNITFVVNHTLIKKGVNKKSNHSHVSKGGASQMALTLGLPL